jgi:phage shock protein A
MKDILIRFFNLFRGASYRLLHELETVEHQSVLAIADFQKNIEKLSEAVLAVGKNLEMLKDEVKEAQGIVAVTTSQIDRALDAQEMFTAKGQTKEANELEEQILKWATELAVQQQNLDMYVDSLNNNTPKYEALVVQLKEQKVEKITLEQELTFLKNQYTLAKRELEIAKMLDENTSTSIRSRVNDVRQRVKDKSAAARAQQALNTAMSNKPSKEVQNTLKNITAQATLAELRNKRMKTIDAKVVNPSQEFVKITNQKQPVI